MTILVYKQFDFLFLSIYLYMYVKWVHLQIMIEVFVLN